MNNDAAGVIIADLRAALEQARRERDKAIAERDHEREACLRAEREKDLSARLHTAQEVLTAIGKVYDRNVIGLCCCRCDRPVTFCDSEPVQPAFQCAGRIARRALAAQPVPTEPRMEPGQRCVRLTGHAMDGRQHEFDQRSHEAWQYGDFPNHRERRCPYVEPTPPSTRGTCERCGSSKGSFNMAGDKNVCDCCKVGCPDCATPHQTTEKQP